MSNIPKNTRDAIGAHLAKTWTAHDGACPYCGGKTREPHGYLNLPLAGRPGAIEAEPALCMALVALVCTGCGDVALLNIDKAGIPA